MWTGIAYPLTGTLVAKGNDKFAFTEALILSVTFDFQTTNRRYNQGHLLMRVNDLHNIGFVATLLADDSCHCTVGLIFNSDNTC